MTKTRNIFAAIALAGALGLSLSGCITVQAPANSGGGGSVTQEQSGSASEQYLNDVRAEYPALDSIKDDMLLSVGQSACDALASGAKYEDLLVVADQADLPAGMGAALVEAAVTDLCPEEA